MPVYYEPRRLSPLSSSGLNLDTIRGVIELDAFWHQNSFGTGNDPLDLKVEEVTDFIYWVGSCGPDCLGISTNTVVTPVATYSGILENWFDYITPNEKKLTVKFESWQMNRMFTDGIFPNHWGDYKLTTRPLNFNGSWLLDEDVGQIFDSGSYGIAVKFKVDSVIGTQGLYAHCVSGSLESKRVGMYLDGSTLRFQTDRGDINQNVQAAGVVVANQWHIAYGGWLETTGLYISLDGENIPTPSTTGVVIGDLTIGANRTVIGSQTPLGINTFSGDMEWIAGWENETRDTDSQTEINKFSDIDQDVLTVLDGSGNPPILYQNLLGGINPTHSLHQSGLNLIKNT